jgi:hypothetical protein
MEEIFPEGTKVRAKYLLNRKTMASNSLIEDIFGDDDDDNIVNSSRSKVPAASKSSQDSDNDSSQSSNSSSSGSSSSDSDSDSSSSVSVKRQKVLGKGPRALGKKSAPIDRPQREVVAKNPGLPGEGAPALPKGKRKSGGNDSGGEYDSEPELERTADDDAFIDRDDDDAELLAEYDADAQDFHDEGPSGRRTKKKKLSAKRTRNLAEGEGSDLESGAAGASESGKGKGGKKKKEMSDAEKASIVRELLKEMQNAAKQDRLDRANSKPAVAKLKLIPAVKAAVANQQLQGTLLDGVASGANADYSAASNPTILTLFREWLKPLPGTNLPSLQVRQLVYDSLSVHLPVTPIHLKLSKLGEIIGALSAHPEETSENKLMLKKLMEKISRMIFSKSDRYDRVGIDTILAAQTQMGLYSSEKGKGGGDEGSSNPSATKAGSASGSSGAQIDLALEEDANAQENNYRHASRPAQLVFDYVKRPTVSAAPEAAPTKRSALQDSLHGVTLAGQIALHKKNKRKVGIDRPIKISIEGRGL